MAKCPKKINFLGDPRRFELDAELSLLELALQNKIPINTSCEGMGTCGACLVEITESSQPLPPKNAIELEMSEARGHKATERLACQTRCNQAITVKTQIED